MNVETITMPKDQAVAALQQYRASIARGRNAEYEAIAKGLEAIAKGRPILNLPDAIRRGGFDELDRPRLAVARSDRKQITFLWWPSNTRATFSTVDWGARSRSDSHSIDFGRRPHADVVANGRVEAFAMVPVVPPRALTQAKLRTTSGLGKLVTLWEVDQWHTKQQNLRPSRDPYLLRLLGGDLYEVLAEWDLTPLERAVIAGTRR
jgi:hypothetical protein